MAPRGGGGAAFCRDLQDGIDAAAPGDEVWVARGAYGPIKLNSGVKVYGGFAGTETSASSSDPELHGTYIDGERSSQAVLGVGTDSSTVLRGFTIRNGAALGWTGAGGGLYLEDSSPMIVRCVFTENTAQFAGGAVANYLGGSPTFVNCRFHANGGVGQSLMPVGAGAFFNHDGSPVLTNCLFDGNKADEGGAIISLQSTLSLTNCTLTENEAVGGKGGALFDRRGSVALRNCVLWNNRAKREGTGEIFNDASRWRTTDVAHSDVQGGWAGAGNINTDPLFVDASRQDYRLARESACRDSANNASLPADIANMAWDEKPGERVPLGLGLSQRISGTAVDMGAYEWAPDQQ